MSKKIEVLATSIRVSGINDQDYICLTDIARYKDAERTDYLIFNWLRNRNTIEFLGLWEQINNPGFNPIEFDGIRFRLPDPQREIIGKPMAPARCSTPKGLRPPAQGWRLAYPGEGTILIPNPKGVSSRSVRPGSTKGPKPRWGLRTLASPRGSSSFLVATPGWQMQPLRGITKGASGFPILSCGGSGSLNLES